MIDASSDIVPDASTGIKLFIPEDLSENAQRLFQLLASEDGPTFFVPDLFYVECANVFWKYSVRTGYRSADVMRDLKYLKKLDLQAVPTYELYESAYKIAREYFITVYDACYVCLAREIGGTLVTADRALIGKMKHSSFSIAWLGEI